MKVWRFILQKMEASIPVMLLYVLESKGSSPGRQGFCMAVAAGGELCGSIGGGIMEHKFAEMAKARLEDDNYAAAIHKQVHDKAAGKNQSGMICSGEQTIFLYKVESTDLPAIRQLLLSADAYKNGSLVLTEAGIRFNHDIPSADFHFFQSSESSFQLTEKTGYKNELHIIGGGHCALALSKLMREMDFYTRVYEERADLNTMAANHFAHEKIMVESYSELDKNIEGGNNVYVAIMTFGYRTDDLALRSLLNTPFRYIGLLGSRKKVEKLLAEYNNSGKYKAVLSTIHSPIGLSIKSKTPMEIAVSIAAEIIAEKNRYQ